MLTSFFVPGLWSSQDFSSKSHRLHSRGRTPSTPSTAGYGHLGEAQPNGAIAACTTAPKSCVRVSRHCSSMVSEVQRKATGSDLRAEAVAGVKSSFPVHPIALMLLMPSPPTGYQVTRDPLAGLCGWKGRRDAFSKQR